LETGCLVAQQASPVVLASQVVTVPQEEAVQQVVDLLEGSWQVAPQDGLGMAGKVALHPLCLLNGPCLKSRTTPMAMLE
jgi:hypothetical protein